MTREHIVLNSIFYIVLTAFFIYIFVKEKAIVAKIEKKRTKVEDTLVDRFGLSGTKEKILRKTIKLVESLGTALILVLIIQRFYLGNFMVPTGSMIPTIVPGDRLFGNMVVYKFKAPEREDIIVFKEPIEDKVLYTKRLMGLPGENLSIKYGKLFVNGTKVSDRYYSAIGEIGPKEWRVPKKGDKVTIVPGADYNERFKSQQIDIEKVQKVLLENTGYVSELLPDVKFMIDGKETGKIMDYLHDKTILEKILRGESVEVTLDEDYYMAMGDNTDGSYDSRMWGFVKDSRIRGRAFVRFWPLNRVGLLK